MDDDSSHVCGDLEECQQWPKQLQIERRTFSICRRGTSPKKKSPPTPKTGICSFFPINFLLTSAPRPASAFEERFDGVMVYPSLYLDTLSWSATVLNEDLMHLPSQIALSPPGAAVHPAYSSISSGVSADGSRISLRIHCVQNTRSLPARSISGKSGTRKKTRCQSVRVSHIASVWLSVPPVAWKP